MPALISFQANLRWNVKDQQAAVETKSAREVAQFAASIWLERRTIRDCKASQRKALLDNEVEEFKGVAVHLLVILVVTNHRPAVVGRDNVGGWKALYCEGAFTGTGGSA
jgi:hypothetical protein